ncbi:molybdopterin synthase [Synchytrium endobioticum]|uniref:Molybdopterin synthase n=1 Tax=Synchytrium endobioticum TaxID=286115 RepID=A0A507CMA2_9FUNG|nr:molybdopterin synthase [Synchytrium endobioticum]
MKIKAVGYLMLLGGLFVSHVIGLPMNRHESHQDDASAATPRPNPTVNEVTTLPIDDNEAEKAQMRKKFQIVEKWLGGSIPKGLELGQLELVYTPSKEPFKVWKEQIGLANELLSKLKSRKKINLMKGEENVIMGGLLAEYFDAMKGNPPFAAYDLIRKHNYMKQFCEALELFLQLMIRLHDYLGVQSTAMRKKLSNTVDIDREGLQYQIDLYKTQSRCLKFLPTANDEEYANIKKYFETAQEDVKVSLEKNREMLRKRVEDLEAWWSTGSVEVVEKHPDLERSASTRSTPDDDQSSPEPSASHHHPSYQPARKRNSGNKRSSRRMCRVDHERSSESDRSVSGQSIGFAQDRDHVQDLNNNLVQKILMMWQDQDNHGSSSANHDNRDHVSITESPLNLSEIVNLVRDGGAGAMATFSGTTRNYFIVEGITKKVTLLSYEAYVPMAIKELHNCISQARKLYPSIISAVIQHRIGDVAIGKNQL